LGRILRLAHVSLTVAGRTDAGVHARGQVAHVDIATSTLDTLPASRLAGRLARLLPEDVRVARVELAPDGFDARFSAIWRRYAYRIVDDPAAADPLGRHMVLPWPRRLDAAAMHSAARPLLGEHDFAAFCRRREGATTVRALIDLDVTRDGHEVGVQVRADAFCHSMVRSLVGALVAVGEGRRDVGWPRDVLAHGVRDSGVTVLPPRGLTLEEVGYPDPDALAARAATTRSIRTLS
ncbi:MAG TPA: tRNA pseudouridine synthase A, partial [Nocardioidaceae bacterium]|nr:tRNA pseudouridine synthase A [Nocardioidaceae bacterium]